MEKLKSFIENEKVKGATTIISAIIMWFSPNSLDHTIETLLATPGIQKLVAVEKEK